MRTILALLFLWSCSAFGQTSKDPKFFHKRLGAGDSAVYVPRLNSSLAGYDANGRADLVPRDTFALHTDLEAVDAARIFGDDALHDEVLAEESARIAADALKADEDHTHVSVDITDASDGGNGSSDKDKLLKFHDEGQIHGSVENSSQAAVWGQTLGTGYAGLFTGGAATISLSTPTIGVEISSGAIPIEITQTSSGDIAHFFKLGGTGMEIENDGSLNWTSATGIANTKTELSLNNVENTAASTLYVPLTRTISTTSPLNGGGALSGNLTLGIGNARANGSTLGAAAFTTNDFDDAVGVISLDYTNGQAASGSTKGFLTSADWTTFNSKQATDAELSALAGLTSAADKLPYFTGSGTAATTDLSSFSRTVLAQTTQAGYLSAIANTTLATLSGDFTTTSTSFVDVTDVTAALTTTAVYNVEVFGEWSTNNNSGTITVSLDVPAGATVTGYRQASIASNSVSNSGISGADTGNNISAIGTANARCFFMINAKVVTAGTSGNITLRLLSGNAAWTAKVFQGCSIRVTRVQ